MIDLSAASTTIEDESCNSYIGQTVADILRREFRHEFVADGLACIQTPAGQVFGCNTDDQHLLSYMPQLKRLYKSIMASDDPPVEVFVPWARRSAFKLTKLGKQVLQTCEVFATREDERRDWQRAYAHHQFHPAVAVTFAAVIRWWEPICTWWQPARGVVLEGSDAQAVEGLRHLVEHVRSVCRSQSFKNLLHDHEKKAKDNFRSGCDHIIEQFERHARLLVLRIDLYFRPDAKGWSYSKEANEALEKYLRALRMGRIVPGNLGFIIKRENGISRGMHFHLMVFLDGHMHRSAYHLTKVMGESWIKRVGTDKGSFFNCYAKKDRYRFNGLGLVHFSDTEKLIGIRIALHYMSKQDSVLMVDNDMGKNFWRSWKVKGDGNRGAPRKHGDGMDLVKRLLGGERSKYPPGFEPPKSDASVPRRVAEM